MTETFPLFKCIFWLLIVYHYFIETIRYSRRRIFQVLLQKWVWMYRRDRFTFWPTYHHDHVRQYTYRHWHIAYVYLWKSRVHVKVAFCYFNALCLSSLLSKKLKIVAILVTQLQRCNSRLLLTQNFLRLSKCVYLRRPKCNYQIRSVYYTFELTQALNAYVSVKLNDKMKTATFSCINDKFENRKKR